MVVPATKIRRPTPRATPVKRTDCLIRLLAVAMFVFAVVTGRSLELCAITSAVVVSLEAMSYGRAQCFAVRIGRWFRLATRGG
jgi:energy-coupling factor transporter transmembrane protein EcfT